MDGGHPLDCNFGAAMANAFGAASSGGTEAVDNTASETRHADDSEKAVSELVIADFQLPIFDFP